MAIKTYQLAVRRVVNLRATCRVDTESEDYKTFAESYDTEFFTEDDIIDEYVEQGEWTLGEQDIAEEEVMNCGEIK